jgi:SAM-dependent methyltransferase
LPKLNIGAGDDRRDGYWSVDLRPDVADVVADITRLPFADDSVAELFASDLLEHFPATKTQGLLAEWRRVLAPGGKLTLRVPNLLALARLLIEHPHTRPDVIRNIYGGHRFGPDGAWDTHHTGWTPDLLHEELTRAGFVVMSDDGQPNNTVTAMRSG